MFFIIHAYYTYNNLPIDIEIILITILHYICIYNYNKYNILLILNVHFYYKLKHVHCLIKMHPVLFYALFLL